MQVRRPKGRDYKGNAGVVREKCSTCGYVRGLAEETSKAEVEIHQGENEESNELQ